MSRKVICAAHENEAGGSDQAQMASRIPIKIIAGSSWELFEYHVFFLRVEIRNELPPVYAIAHAIGHDQSVLYMCTAVLLRTRRDFLFGEVRPVLWNFSSIISGLLLMTVIGSEKEKS